MKPGHHSYHHQTTKLHHQYRLFPVVMFRKNIGEIKKERIGIKERERKQTSEAASLV